MLTCFCIVVSIYLPVYLHIFVQRNVTVILPIVMLCSLSISTALWCFAKSLSVYHWYEYE